MTDPPPDDPRWPERRDTDRSLREERDRSDVEVDRLQALVERDVEAAVAAARDRANAALARARARADEVADPDGAPMRPTAAVEAERVAQDHALGTERQAEDDARRTERAATRRIAEARFAQERAQTDATLRTERAAADTLAEAVDEALSRVAHDLRTSVVAVRLDADTLARGGVPPDELRAMADRLKTGARFMGRVIEDLSDAARLAAGRLALVLATQDVAALLEETRASFAHVAAAKGLRLDVETDVGAVLVRCDPHRVLQVLANLVANAVKFTATGGRILLRAVVEGRWVRVSVLDTGAGVPADLHEAIFERFVQGQPGSSGLGLGLYIARAIVVAHGGRMWVESTPPGGSEFFFTLPIAEDPSNPAAPEPTI